MASPGSSNHTAPTNHCSFLFSSCLDPLWHIPHSHAEKFSKNTSPIPFHFCLKFFNQIYHFIIHCSHTCIMSYIYLETVKSCEGSNCLTHIKQSSLIHSKTYIMGNSTVVQCLGHGAFTAEGPGSIPSQGTKIPQATWLGFKKKSVCIYYIYVCVYIYIYIYIYTHI